MLIGCDTDMAGLTMYDVGNSWLACDARRCEPLVALADEELFHVLDCVITRIH